MTDLCESVWNLSLEPLKASYRQGGDLPWGVPAQKVIWLFDCMALLLYPHYDGANGHQTWQGDN